MPTPRKSRKFDDLRKKMSPERQARNKAEAARLLAEMDKKKALGLISYHCCACKHEFESVDPNARCPKCGSEDTFDKEDDGWPCTVCKDESEKAEMGKFGFICSKCR